MRDRRCIECDAPITACMGSCLARDIVDATEKTIPWRWVRELCGKCTMRFILAGGLREAIKAEGA